MGRIKGHYEWDDDDLSPGRNRGGGLHQNLFDVSGKLKGSARFVPDDGSEPEPFIVTEKVYVPIEERRRSREDEELQRAIAGLLILLIDVGVMKGRPLAEKWWRETARPAIDAKRAALHERRLRRKLAKEPAVPGGAAVEPAHEPQESPIEDRPIMSSAEAQARCLAAIAARAYSDEQMRLVGNADVVDANGLADLRRSLRQLPADQVKSLIEEMVRNPLMLGEDTLADLASILGRRSIETQHDPGRPR